MAESAKQAAGLSKDDVLEAIANMSVMDIVDLVAAMEEKFGVSAAAPVAVAAAGAAPAEAAAAEEKDEFDVILAAAGDKVPTIKAVRAITGLGLKEAKDLVDGAPSPLKEGVPKAEAEEMKKQLEEAGAKVELK